MNITESQTGEKKEVIIEPADDADFKIVRNNKTRFKFNWNKYKGREVYKLYLKDANDILGMMCITEHSDPATNAIEIALLEVGSENVGKKKKFEKIAGCLIAYACRESFKRGHDGFIFLTPKTNLIKHYSSKYNMHYIPPLGNKLEGFMLIEGATSLRLIRKYLDEE